MKELEKLGLNKQEDTTLSSEQKKLKDFEFLKKQPISGLFTTVEDVDLFMSST